LRSEETEWQNTCTAHAHGVKAIFGLSCRRPNTTLDFKPLTVSVWCAAIDLLGL
jgi:hypothetical protein